MKKYLSIFCILALSCSNENTKVKTNQHKHDKYFYHEYISTIAMNVVFTNELWNYDDKKLFEQRNTHFTQGIFLKDENYFRDKINDIFKDKYALHSRNFNGTRQRIYINSNIYYSYNNTQSPDVIEINRYFKILNSLGYKFHIINLLELILKTQVFRNRICGNSGIYNGLKFIPGYNISWEEVLGIANYYKNSDLTNNDEICLNDDDYKINKVKLEKSNFSIENAIFDYKNRFNEYYKILDSLSNEESYISEKKGEFYVIARQEDFPFPIFKIKYLNVNGCYQIKKEILNPESLFGQIYTCL